MRTFPERRKTLNVFREAAATWGSYDDFPVAPLGVDPSPHLSRNRVPQPFYLVTAQDEVLVTMSGQGVIRFKDPDRTVLPIGPGDVVYLPARLPSQIIPTDELLQVRLKGDPPFKEAVAWYCDDCDNLVHSFEFSAEVPQRCYWDAVVEYNADPGLRTCPNCGRVHPEVDLGDIAWEDIAAALDERTRDASARTVPSR